MRIAVLTTSFPLKADGSEAAGAFVADFAEALSKLAEVRVIAPAQIAGLERRGDCVIHRFACARLPLSLLSPINPLHWPAIAQALTGGWRALEAAHLELAFDHVLALWALPSGNWALRLKRRYGVPYSTWALGSDIWRLGSFPVIKTRLRTVLRKAHFRYADGSQLQQAVKTIADMPCDFLASARWLPRQRTVSPALQPPYRVAFLGRWHHNKGADLLIDALLKLTDKDWQHIAAFRYCGGGPQAAEIEAGIARLQAAGRPITLSGFLDREQAAELLGWTDWLVIPSRIESIPVIYSDALQAGCRILSTPVGDLPQLVPKSGGEVAIEASAEGLATAMSQCFSQTQKPLVESDHLLTSFSPKHSAAAFVTRVKNTP